ncbi:MAG: YidC/Oxa1 family membrane protein insertase [Clostridiales bacterium]|nr:YidC/Oxa1 family membrane protein insertase [Clostridiales bacterium]
MNMLSPILLKMTAGGGGLFMPLYWFFGKCMHFLLEILQNDYFIAIILFTVLTRLVLLPINVRQQKTTAKSARIQPKIQKIQKKYNVQGITDMNQRRKMQAKMNEEMQELYAREGHNPMQMGCGPMAFQMIFLMGIVGIIYYPLSYVIGIGNINDQSAYLIELLEKANYDGRYLQLGILENWDALRETVAAKLPDMFTADKITAIDNFRSGLYIGNLDMTAIPHWKDGIIVIVPIMSFITSLGSTIISSMISKKNNPAAAQQMRQMMIMMLMMPIFSLVIAFQVPAAVGFYWIISNLIAIIQQLFIAKFFPPRKSQAKIMVENTIERRSREENIKKIK